MARTRSKSRIKIPIIKLEEKEQSEAILNTHNDSRPLKKPKVISSTSTIHQLTRVKFENLKPSYKDVKPKREVVKKSGDHGIPNKIANVNKSITPNLISNIAELSEHLERLNRFKTLKNFDIDIRTVKMLNSNIENYTEHDLKLIGLFQESPNDLTKMYGLYDIEPPLNFGSNDSKKVKTTPAMQMKNDYDNIPFL